MPIIKNDSVFENDWVALDDADPSDMDRSLSLLATPGDWEHHQTILATFPRLGLRLAPEDAVEAIADALDHIELVVLEFPKFNDGRGFSQARLLRDRFGFTGEIRATGHVLRDQFGFLRRSGVDAVEVDDVDLINAWRHERDRFIGHYQPAFGDRKGGAARPSANRINLPAPTGIACAAAWAY